MDTTTTIIAIVIVLLCSLPIFCMNMARRSRERRGKQSLQHLADTYGAVLHEYHIAHQFRIGIDTEKRLLFFIRLDADKNETASSVELRRYAKCRVQSKEHSEGPKGDTYTVTDLVALELVLKAQDESVSLPFYNAVTDRLAPAGELRLAEQWQRIIGNCL